ncbi:hypothetical protein J6A31_04755 [bacterium]|nr:hypothetical protein [bacterium]
MLDRVELFDYHNVILVSLDDNQYYVYCLPVYYNCDNGRSVLPDDEWMYLIPQAVYDGLLTLKKENMTMCKYHVEHNIDDLLLHGFLPDGFVKLGNSRDYLGSQLSAVTQALVKYQAGMMSV